ncbi:sulfatase [Haloferula sp.]|uniref:sulfatase n=1 Tax=Haloferula sp. TaxID=2497595 RepID=UPI00329C8651
MPARPNVLFVSIDDLNDWIEPLGGHPQVQTPHLKRLAAQSVNFTRNYCPSPGCNPSRSAVMTGRSPATSGMYSNYQDWRKVMPDAVTIGEHFRNNGYFSAGAGKIFHYTQVAPKCWDDYFPSIEKPMPDFHYPKPGKTVNMPKFKGMYGDFDWAPIPLQDEETGDGKCVDWITKQLSRSHDKPFFLACGIYRPHLPWYVPQEYFDLYPLDTIQLPEAPHGDLDDLGERAHEIATRGGDYHKHVTEAGQWKQAVQGYLASISFADAMLGQLLDALEKSPYADNTIVVVWSDHGWQLGDKQHWRKFALWDQTVRCVLMMKVPKGTPALANGTATGSDCQRVTSLIDIYPTLVELCGLSSRSDLDGNSLVPLLKNPASPWDHPAITAYNFSEFAITTERWRYIRYIDDSDELYDFKNDPDERHNLTNNEQSATTKARLAKLIPQDPAPLRTETLIALQPHHVHPFQSKEDYKRRKQLHQKDVEKN